MSQSKSANMGLLDIAKSARGHNAFLAFVIFLGGLVGGCGRDANSAPNNCEDTICSIGQDFDGIILNFETSDAILEEDGVILDQNRGVLTLPTESLPPFSLATRELLFTSRETIREEISGALVFVGGSAELAFLDGGTITGDEVIISGRIEVGSGGLLISANKKLEITGTIESRGPVTLATDVEGIIDISGAIRLQSNGNAEEQIRIVGRGQTELSGVIEIIPHAGREEQTENRAIEIDTYGPLFVDGGRMEAPGRSRGILLRSDDAVTLREESQVLASAGAEVVVEAQSVVLEQSTITFAEANIETGGKVQIRSNSLSLRKGAQIIAGQGNEPGRFEIESSTVTLASASAIRAGKGSENPPSSFVRATHLEMSGASEISGADVRCGSGGDIQILVAGRVSISSASQIRGGSVIEAGGCPANLEAGGNVEIEAHTFNTQPDAFAGGTGSISGSVRQNVNPSRTLNFREIIPRPSGFALSKRFLREAGISGAPTIARFERLLPPGTQARVFVQSANFESEILREGERLDVFEDATSLQFRFELSGRRFDAPILDHLEIAF